jgi:hypothetical protein
MMEQQYQGNPREWPDGIYEALNRPVSILVKEGKAVLFVNLDDFGIEEAQLIYQRKAERK